MKETLTQILADIDLSNYAKTIQKYLFSQYDPMKATMIRKEIESGNLESLNDNDIESIIGILQGGEKPKKELKDNDEKDNKEVKVLNEAYSLTLEENRILRDSIKELQSQISQYKNELTQYETINLKEIESILEENKRFRKMFLLTEMKQLINVDDNDINELYLKYKSEGKEIFKSAFVSIKNNNPIIPKSYYVLERGEPNEV